tara:strand:+ start:24 stop:290 length:267 start_codon:yes stop_codon:yes gene_type:complete
MFILIFKAFIFIKEICVIVISPYILCCKYNKLKSSLKKAGYIVDLPLEYLLYLEDYSLTKIGGILTVKVYTKLRKIYTIEEIKKIHRI